MPQIERQQIPSSAKTNEVKGVCTRVLDWLVATERSIYITAISKADILEELPKLTKSEHEIRLKLAELDDEVWFEEEEALTAHEKALLGARLPAYAKDPDAGSSWKEVESRVRVSPCPKGRMNDPPTISA